MSTARRFRSTAASPRRCPIRASRFSKRCRVPDAAGAQDRSDRHPLFPVIARSSCDEAIQTRSLGESLDCFAALAMTEQEGSVSHLQLVHRLQTYRLPTRLRVLAASFARALLVVLALLWKRTQGRPGARCSHGRLCARMRVHLAQAENHRAAETSRPSLRDGFTAYVALSPGSDALLPPSPCERSQRLAHSLSGARTTRFCRTRDCARRACETIVSRDAAASTAARPACRDDRDTPLFLGPGCRETYVVSEVR